MGVLAGCDDDTGPVGVDGDPPTDAATAAACVELVDSLPDQVLDQQQRDVKAGDGWAAAWGDPAIVLRCGVAKPAALVPTSECLVVNHVGWLATQAGKALDLSTTPEGTVDFYTIGRSATVELSVPDKWSPQADALVDVASAISRATTEPQPCQ